MSILFHQLWRLPLRIFWCARMNPVDEMRSTFQHTHFHSVPDFADECLSGQEVEHGWYSRNVAGAYLMCPNFHAKTTAKLLLLHMFFTLLAETDRWSGQFLCTKVIFVFAIKFYFLGLVCRIYLLCSYYLLFIFKTVVNMFFLTRVEPEMDCFSSDLGYSGARALSKYGSYVLQVCIAIEMLFCWTFQHSWANLKGSAPWPSCCEQNLVQPNLLPYLHVCLHARMYVSLFACVYFVHVNTCPYEFQINAS